MFRIHKDMISDGFKTSSSRFFMIRMLYMIEFIGYSSVIIQVIQVCKGNDLDWDGYAIFIGSITTVVAALVTGKYFQAKVESTNNNRHGKNKQVCEPGGGDEESTSNEEGN